MTAKVKIVDAKRVWNSRQGRPRYRVWVRYKRNTFCLVTETNGNISEKFNLDMCGTLKTITFKVEDETRRYVMTDIQ